MFFGQILRINQDSEQSEKCLFILMLLYCVYLLSYIIPRNTTIKKTFCVEFYFGKITKYSRKITDEELVWLMSHY